MATRHERAAREADPSGVSLVSFSVWPGADGVVILDTALHDDFVGRRHIASLPSPVPSSTERCSPARSEGPPT
jgi:hypothetical protein